MANHVVIVGWNKPTAGREKQAMKLFEKAMGNYVKWQNEGRIESFEPVLLSWHGGDLNGFVILRGNAKKMADLKSDDAWIELVVESGYCLENFGVVDGYTGDSMMKMFERYSKLIS